TPSTPRRCVSGRHTSTATAGLRTLSSHWPRTCPRSWTGWPLLSIALPVPRLSPRSVAAPSSSTANGHGKPRPSGTAAGARTPNCATSWSQRRSTARNSHTARTRPRNGSRPCRHSTLAPAGPASPTSPSATPATSPGPAPRSALWTVTHDPLRLLQHPRGRHLPLPRLHRNATHRPRTNRGPRAGPTGRRRQDPQPAAQRPSLRQHGARPALQPPRRGPPTVHHRRRRTAHRAARTAHETDRPHRNPGESGLVRATDARRALHPLDRRGPRRHRLPGPRHGRRGRQAQPPYLNPEALPGLRRAARVRT